MALSLSRNSGAPSPGAAAPVLLADGLAGAGAGWKEGAEFAGAKLDSDELAAVQPDKTNEPRAAAPNASRLRRELSGAWWPSGETGIA